MSRTYRSMGNRLGRCIRAPLRALCRARDFYVRSMTGCANRMYYGGSATAAISLPSVSRSSSMNGGWSADEDLLELMRAASQSRTRAAAADEGSVKRSQSVAAVRIDEDKPYEFSGDVKVGGSLIFPRSRSYAVGGKSRSATHAWKYN
ncbi:hypothetical protein HPP92_017259 [Vanilla planifolia]|uniref:Uncharacterized protein n=1 Tax=Vanilla planifolia TaxID=51239 RepID=A0A835Q7P1_VANPL|nr:hypothetical protein HPP92_017259 [Vanilla planifolia]